MSKKKLPKGFLTLRARYRAGQSILAKQYKTEYETYIRNFRHDVAKAKKAGLISKKVDARKAMPTAQITKQLNDAAPVLRGKVKAHKIPKGVSKQQLKEMNIEVIKDRAILRKDIKIDKKGNLIIGTGKIKTKVTVLSTGSDIQKFATRVFPQLKGEETLVIPLPGGNASNLFSSHMMQEFIAKATEYLDGGLDANGKKRAGLKYIMVQQLQSYGQAEDWDQERIDNLKIEISKRKQEKAQIKKTEKVSKKKAREAKAKSIKRRVRKPKTK